VVKNGANFLKLLCDYQLLEKAFFFLLGVILHKEHMARLRVSVRLSSFCSFYLELPSCRNVCDVIRLHSQTHRLLNYITRNTNAKELILRRQFK